VQMYRRCRQCRCTEGADSADVQKCPVTVSEKLQLVKLRGLKVCTAAVLFLLTTRKFSAGLRIGTG